MKLIVGLGNPGKAYELTRHNIGFRVVDVLAKRWDFALTSEKFHAWFDKGVIGRTPAAMLKPTTFMNRSGQAVLAAGRFFRLEQADVLIVYDDVALELGRLRIRKRGSAGGHNGLDDVITRLGTEDICRLRIGIGAPRGSQTQYVLSRFADAEEAIVAATLARAADAVECWANEGADTAMNRFNVAGSDATGPDEA